MLTTEELFREYIKLFTLIVETAGDISGNKSYLSVEEILKNNENSIKSTIEMDIQFEPFVASLIFYVILDIHGASNLAGMENTDKIKDYIDDFWNRYLKKPTWKFTSKHGLPRIDKLETYIGLLIKNKEK